MIRLWFWCVMFLLSTTSFLLSPLTLLTSLFISIALNSLVYRSKWAFSPSLITKGKAYKYVRVCLSLGSILYRVSFIVYHIAIAIFSAYATNWTLITIGRTISWVSITFGKIHFLLNCMRRLSINIASKLLFKIK